MLTHRGFSAWIEVDEKPLPEYLVAVDNSANRVSCWIPSEEGKAFTVFWTDHGGKVPSSGYVTLDGHLTSGRYLYGKGTTGRGSIRTGPDTGKSFIFKKIQEDGNGGTAVVGRNVGTIVLEISRIKIVGSTSRNTIQSLPEAGPSRHGMRIGFGKEQPFPEQDPSTWVVEPYDNPGEDVPSIYVSFLFRYRTPEFLRNQGIIDDSAPADAQLPAIHPQVAEQRVANTPVVSGTVVQNPDPSVIESSSEPVYISMSSKKDPEDDDGDDDELSYPGQGMIYFPTQKRA